MSMRMIMCAIAIAIACPVTAASAAAPPSKAAVYSTATTPIGTLLDDTASRAVLDKYMPGFSGNFKVRFVRGQTLRQIQPMSDGGITDATLAKIDAGLAKIKVR